ncbi:hypothetical protein OS493_014787 [Desmophyllum pertusum]|uniref:REJ domain-containing protein n=1 Tax=Desmophyllum pertusum TaxID=174260 RepID=A0A9W9YGD9_9CNID|nr:hypothetical protein OS493_014787 [Desmophyllum pertusum]
MKSSIVKQLSAIKVETVERVQQTSNVIAEATSVISEVTVEAQKAATDALQSMTVVLKKESSAGTSYEALFDSARSLATGLGSMLRVSAYGLDHTTQVTIMEIRPMYSAGEGASGSGYFR